MKKNDLISIIIPTYNCVNYISSCLDSLKKLSYKPCEIIVVDDCSNDGTTKLLKKQTQIKLFVQKSNLGPAIARNIGVNNARGKYLLFLDSDTRIEKNCLQKIVLEFNKDKKLGAIQALLYKNDSKIVDSSGHFLSFIGFPYESELNKLSNNIVFGAKSAGMAVRRDLFIKTGGFDEDYFIYGEETDLCWRIWNAGYSIKLLREAKVFHFEKSSLNNKTYFRIFYEGSKNNTCNILKNADFTTILWLAPVHITSWICFSLYLLIKGRKDDSHWIIKGLLWNIKNINKILKKRKLNFKTTKGIENCKKIMFGEKNLLTLIKQGINWAKNV